MKILQSARRFLWSKAKTAQGTKKRQGSCSALQRYQKNNILLHLSIGKRLALSFLLSALIATGLASIIGLQHEMALQRQSDFYQNLLQANITLTTDSNYLLLMETETNALLNDASVAHPSQETLAAEENAIIRLGNLYGDTLAHYNRYDLLKEHPDQATLLAEASSMVQVTNQYTLAQSALYSWHVAQEAQLSVLHAVMTRQIQDAQHLNQAQAEPTSDDALSALHALQRFDLRLISIVQATAQEETRKAVIETIAAALLACSSIILIGWSMTHTLVSRLQHLQQITHAVEQGQLDARVAIYGSDEIAAVSTAVNKMLATMVTNQQMAIAYERQRRLSELKDQFITNVNHELRTPLTQVYGYLELLSEYHGQSDLATRTQFINHAREGCQELMDLVNTILDAAHAADEIKSPLLEEIHVTHFIRGLRESFTPQENQRLRLDLPEDVKVMADRRYLRRVLQNLLSNALKYSPAEMPVTVSATVSEKPGSDHGQVTVCVQDVGPGIPPEEIPLLFQKFVRLKRDLSGTVRGTGLGLYISKQLVQSMNGTIWVESSGKAGEGSRFFFTLSQGASTPLDPHASSDESS